MATASHGQARAHRKTRPTRVERRVLDVCEAAGSFIEYWGFRAVFGKTWVLLAVRNSPMSQVEVAEMLGVSRSLMSGVVAELEGRGLVRRVGRNRNAPYEAVIDVWPTITEVLRSREWMLLEQARLALEAAIEEAELAGPHGEAAPYNLARMRALLAMTESAQGFLRVLIGMRVPRALESFAGWAAKAASVVQSFRRST